MKYYQVAVIGSPLSLLTYEYTDTIPAGSLVEVKLRNKLVNGIIYSQCEKPKFSCEQIVKAPDISFSKQYLKIFTFLSQYYLCSFGEAAGLFTAVPKGEERVRFKVACDIELSAKQHEAYNFIKSHDISLLFGDTGSGKTEIYMKLLEDVVNEGKSAIFLMPEISLTPQMQKRLKKKFGDLAAIWHSKITKKKKAEILEGIATGEVKIVAGARSSLFVAMPNLGAIIVDEEHDDSYKASSRPRYHARDMAIYMGKVLGARVVLGSATPSLTTYHKFPHFRLKETFFDTKKSIVFLKEEEGISERILHELSITLAQNHQAIIFLPTRANYKYLTCMECGKFVECPFCAVGMSIHKEKNALRCHYCNYMQRIVDICPSCNGRHLRVNRIGTAQVTAELCEKFPDKRFVKFDRDEVTTQTKLKKILKAFNDKEIDVLVGTQMLSKGHDYHDIRLAVVFGIDTILAQADFRARERAMSLLLQVAGRSGRKGEGKVIVQTNNSEFFAHYMDDFEKFLKDESRFRKGLYPPYKKLMKFMISHKNRQKALTILQRLQVCLGESKDIEVVGFGEAPIARISGKFRFQALLRSDSTKALLQIAHKCKIKECEVDIDPVQFS